MRILTLTDHRTHGEYESIYSLLRHMERLTETDEVWAATRNRSENEELFSVSDCHQVVARRVDEDFQFSKDGAWYENSDCLCSVRDFDVLFLRVDRPISDEFLDSLSERFPKQIIVNNPIGIQETGAKNFLLRFQTFCPPMRICESVTEIRDESARHPIVIKPLRSFGGKGIVRIDGDRGWIGSNETTIDAVLKDLEERITCEGAVLAVKFLKNVDKGDKRVVVVNGEVLGATLRVPARGAWLANVSQGATAHEAEVDDEELAMANEISPALIERGVIVYGFDTLVGDDGKRVLSEINTLNVGGFIQAEDASGKPVVARAAELILEYCCNRCDSHSPM